MNRGAQMGLLTLILALGVGAGFTRFVRHSSNFADVEDRQQIYIEISNAVLSVEVVNTQESIVQGLSGRSEIGADGMLFVFPRRLSTAFWMYDMQFDLDMVWLDGGVVVGVIERVPKPESGTPTHDLPTYSVGQPIEMVLELPAGKAGELGIQVGSKIRRKK